MKTVCITAFTGLDYILYCLFALRFVHFVLRSCFISENQYLMDTPVQKSNEFLVVFLKKKSEL